MRFSFAKLLEQGELNEATDAAKETSKSLGTVYSHDL
jgi:hypothetical protein